MVKRKVLGGPRVYEGERKIAINEPHLNLAAKWPGNSVSTSKYNIITFLPKFLIGK
jgi:phospholipid-transporting ATPase